MSTLPATPRQTPSESFLQGIHRLSGPERRLLLWIRKEKQHGRGLDGSFEIVVDRSSTAFGRRLSFDQIIELLNGLRTKPVTAGAPGLAAWNWIAGFEASPDGSAVTLWLDPRTNAMLANLPPLFTQEDMAIMARFRHSSYSRAIYELYCSIRKQDSPFAAARLELNELRGELGLTTEYQRPGQLYHWALKPAQRELHAVAGLNFQYSPIKNGRNVVAIDLRFGPASASDPLPRHDDATLPLGLESSPAPAPGLTPESEAPRPIACTVAAVVSTMPAPTSAPDAVANRPAASPDGFWWVEILSRATSAPFHMTPAKVRELLDSHDWSRNYWIWALDEIAKRLSKLPDVNNPEAYTWSCLNKLFPEWSASHGGDDGFNDVRLWWIRLSPDQRAQIREELRDTLSPIVPNPLAEGQFLSRWEACAVAEFRRAMPPPAPAGASAA
jgi:Protein involved in initiation of plasmid replication